MRRVLLLGLLIPSLACAVTVTAGELSLSVDDQGRVTALQAGANLIRPGQPLASVVVHGQRRAVTHLTAVGDRWRLEFGDGVALGLTVTPVAGTIELALADVAGEPTAVTFAELVFAAGASQGPPGLLVCGDRTVGFVAAGCTTLVRSGVGQQTARVSAGGELGAGYAGLKAILVAAPQAQTAEVIAAIERRCGIPLGIAAKRAEANRGSYLMISGVTQQNAAEVAEWARRGRFGSVLLLHGTWADYAHGYAVPPRTFPDGLAGLRRVVDQFHAAGVLVGAHCFATKIPKTADRMHPVPDKRLYQDFATTLTADVTAAAADLPVASDLQAWPRPTGTRDLLLDDELVVYEGCTDGARGSFTHCRRGAYGTVAAPHRAGARVAHLYTDEARNIWVIDQQTSLLDEHAAQLAATYNAAGFDWIYFDGAEDVPPPYWCNYSRPKLAVLSKLTRPPVTVESAAQGPFCWHLETRTGQRDYYWVSPSAKDEADDAVAQAVPAARRLFMVPNLGWFPIAGRPGGRGGRGCTTLDDIEYVFGRAAATDSVVSVLCSVDGLRSHPQWDAALDVIRRYETLRLDRRVDEPTRQILLREHRDALLVTDAQGRDRVTRARERPYVATWGDQVRAMQGEAVDGVITTSLLPVGRAVRLDISLDPRRVTFVDHLRRPLTVETKPGARLVIPLRNRVLMLTKGVSGGELQMALRTGLAEPLPPIARWLRADAAQLTGDWALREPPSGAGSRFGPVLTPLAAAAPDGPLRSFATYTFDLPQAGRWLLQARVWCHDTGTNSWWVRPPGGDGPPLMLGNVIGSYDQWYWCPPLELDLPAGRVALQLAPREAAPGQGPLVSALCLSLAESGYEANDADAAVALSH